MKLCRGGYGSLLGAVALVTGLVAAGFGGVVGAGPASAAGTTTCHGGSVSPGIYSYLLIGGACTVDSGSVTVEHNLTVLRGASLVAAYGGSNLNVGGNLDVRANGVLVLGCGSEPFDIICLNGTGSTADTVGGNLTAENALSVVLHHNTIRRNVTVVNGGGGVTCSLFPPALGGFPAYANFESDTVGGNLTVTNWQSCWLGIFRENVAGNVVLFDNIQADPDGSEVASDTIGGDLFCVGNVPNPQIGDSGGTLSTVSGHVVIGQTCPALVAP